MSVQDVVPSQPRTASPCGVAGFEAWMQADAAGLSLALRNLVDNALKFTSQTPDPRLGIRVSVTDTAVQLSVQDNGIGFYMKHHERIFQIFQRLQRAEDYPGTGVGLAMVAKAVERMGGRVRAQSRPGDHCRLQARRAKRHGARQQRRGHQERDQRLLSGHLKCARQPQQHRNAEQQFA